MNTPKVFVDFHNADPSGRLRLNCAGTLQDLARQGVRLKPGEPLRLYSEELEVDGIVQFSEDEHIWVAVIDWSAISGPREGWAGGAEKPHG